MFLFFYSKYYQYQSFPYYLKHISNHLEYSEFTFSTIIISSRIRISRLRTEVVVRVMNVSYLQFFKPNYAEQSCFSVQQDTFFDKYFSVEYIKIIAIYEYHSTCTTIQCYFSKITSWCHHFIQFLSLVVFSDVWTIHLHPWHPQKINQEGYNKI